MAIDIYRVNTYGPYYCGGGSGNYGERWRGHVGDPVWTRKSEDSGEISFSMWGTHDRQWISWVRPNSPCHISLLVNGIEHITGAVMYNYDQCNANWSNAVTASGTIRLTQTNANAYTVLNIDLGVTWRGATQENYFTYYGDNGVYPAIITLTDDFKVLPPEGLTGTIVSKNPTSLTCTCSIDRWSKNTNITGTPYGSQTWNFQARIKTGDTVVATVNLNTNETKNATFNFTGLGLKADTDYYVEFTAKNNYQQTQVINSSTFRFPCLGHIISPDGTDDKIVYFSITDSIEEGENTKYSYRYITES